MKAPAGPDHYSASVHVCPPSFTISIRTAPDATPAVHVEQVWPAREGDVSETMAEFLPPCLNPRHTMSSGSGGRHETLGRDVDVLGTRFQARRPVEMIPVVNPIHTRRSSKNSDAGSTPVTRR